MHGLVGSADSHPAERVPLWLAILVLALAYAAAGMLTLLLGQPLLYPYRALIWPPLGLALVAGLLRGPGVWPGVVIGALLLALGGARLLPTHAAVAIATANVVELLLVVWFLHGRVAPQTMLSRPREMFKFLLAVGAATLAGALLGVSLFSATGITYWSDFRYVAWAWWSADVLSSLVLAPLVLALVHWRSPWSAERAGWFVVALAGLALVGQIVFSGWLPTGKYNYPLSYLPILLIVGIAFRFGAAGATMAMALLVASAIWGTLRGFGPFMRGSLFETSILLQTYLATVAVTLLLMLAFVTASRDAERELTQKRIELEKAGELDMLKNAFLGTISHELRTPLTSVVAYAELLDDEIAGPLTPEQKGYVRRLMDGGEHLSRLVDALLDFAWLTSGQFQLGLEDADLIAVARLALDEHRDAAAEKALALTFEAPEGPLRVPLDPSRFRQVLHVLLDNAIKFTPAGGHVAVRVAAATDHVVLHVSDDGAGISAEKLPHVFDKFVQGESYLTREHGGTGLGLATARAIVEAHGGAIAVESGPEPGTTFSVRLPRAQP